MKQELLKNFPHIWLTLTAFIIFLSVFTIIVFWAYRPKNKALYESAAQLPLQEKE